MFDKLKANLKGHARTEAPARGPPPPIPGNKPRRGPAMMSPDYVPNVRDVFRHRKQFGVNLGAMFVGERWISDRLYSCCEARYSSELSAVQKFVKTHGIEKAREDWENHWQTWFTEKDVRYLTTRGINTIRIPLGYFSLSDQTVVKGTDFEKYHAVYASCWNYIVRVVEMCAQSGMGVLLDLHALPGGQNADAHAGTDYQKEGLYKDKKNRAQALRAVQVLIDKASAYDNIVGVQVINEPSWGKEEFLMPFYSECLAYAASRQQMPIYIGDCWNLGLWSKWAGERDEFCVVDHHYYYCFTDKDHGLPPSQHSANIRKSRELLECAKLARGNIVVGEWSLAMDSASKALEVRSDQRAARRDFAASQLDRYTADAGGFFFWTYKFQVRNNDNEWDIRDMLDFGFLPNPVQKPVVMSHLNLDAEYEKLSQEKYTEHCQYWSQYTLEGQVYEHWRYQEGFRLGWNDAIIFAQSQSRIGYLGEWQKKRLAGHIHASAQTRNAWEFEAGFAAAAQAFNDLL